MTNKEKYENAFIEAFEISKEELAGLEYNSIAQWDSVGHMGLMAALEDSFDVMMEMDEIIDFLVSIKEKKFSKNIMCKLISPCNVTNRKKAFNFDISGIKECQRNRHPLLFIDQISCAIPGVSAMR